MADTQSAVKEIHIEGRYFAYQVQKYSLGCSDYRSRKVLQLDCLLRTLANISYKLDCLICPIRNCARSTCLSTYGDIDTGVKIPP